MWVPNANLLVVESRFQTLKLSHEIASIDDGTLTSSGKISPSRSNLLLAKRSDAQRTRWRQASHNFAVVHFTLDD